MAPRRAKNWATTKASMTRYLEPFHCARLVLQMPANGRKSAEIGVPKCVVLLLFDEVFGRGDLKKLFFSIT